MYMWRMVCGGPCSCTRKTKQTKRQSAAISRSLGKRCLSTAHR